MQFVKDRFNYLFNSTKGLILVAIAMIGIVTAVWGMLSGPMAEMGVREVVIKLLGMDIVQAEREGRIIILYHSIAMAVVAIEVYIINSLLKMKEFFKTAINATITVGYILTMVFGMGFAYFGHNWAFHGVYIFGLSLIFFAGVLLAVALNPWDPEYRVTDNAYAHTRSGASVERIAFFTMAIATLGSVLFGAIPGSYFGNGFEAFLAENVIRQPHKTLFEDAVIGHLHIMLTLIAVALSLIIGRWLNFKGILHTISMHLMWTGTIVISIGAWSVVVVEWAHTIIYVGSVLVMLSALMLVIFGWGKFIREGTAHLAKPTFGQKMKALASDPLKFGPLWQMVFMNFTVSGVGIFMAVKLTEIMRVMPWREERITLTGHWHILSALIATIILMYYGDMVNLKGKVRQWYGWGIIILSDIAFASVTIFELKRLFISEAEQQPLVNVLMILTDLGLGMLLVILAMVMIWRLSDLFKGKGRWTEEATHELSEEVE
ncbi:MAG: hypothetical protein IH589_09015 [Anaerolineales bacterium]|nr:hypothetical protein [Anaerolineales bacterium]